MVQWRFRVVAIASFDFCTDTFRWDRSEVARAIDHFQHSSHSSQRQYAQEHDIPRSTLGDWLRKEFPEHLDPDLVGFFCGAAGHAFLRRLVLALLLVFHHENPCGLRPISRFLDVVELDDFVGSSYGALYSLDAQLQDNLILFGKEERQARAAELVEECLRLSP